MYPKSIRLLVCLFNVCEYTVAIQMVVSLHVVAGNWILRTSAHSSQLCSLSPSSLRPKDLLIIINKYTVAVFRCTRRGHQISLWVVVSHHVVAGIWTQDLWKSSQSVLLPAEPSHQPCFVFWDRVSLCSPGCPGTHFVDQAGLELRNPPASASQSAGIKGVHHHTQRVFCFLSIIFLTHYEVGPLAGSTEYNKKSRNGPRYNINHRLVLL